MVRWLLRVVALAGILFLTGTAFAATSPNDRGLSYPERGTLSVDLPGGIQVNTFTGNLMVSRMLLAVPAKGLPVEFYLTYNSDRRLVSSPFGAGWSLSYNIRYTRDSSGNAYIVWGGGRLDTYTFAGGVFTSPPGVYMTLTEPAVGHLQLKTKHGTEYHFANGAHQKVTSSNDPNGNRLAFAYDTSSRLATVTDASGRTYEMTYNANAQMDTLTEASLGRSYALTYDTSSRLTGIKDPLGNAETFSYNTANSLTAITDKLGQTTSITYTTPAWDAGTRLPQSVAKGGSSFSLGSTPPRRGQLSPTPWEGPGSTSTTPRGG